jgi:hypothetical protein
MVTQARCTVNWNVKDLGNRVAKKKKKRGKIYQGGRGSLGVIHAADDRKRSSITRTNGLLPGEATNDVPQPLPGPHPMFKSPERCKGLVFGPACGLHLGLHGGVDLSSVYRVLNWNEPACSFKSNAKL